MDIKYLSKQLSIKVYSNPRTKTIDKMTSITKMKMNKFIINKKIIPKIIILINGNRNKTI